MNGSCPWVTANPVQARKSTVGGWSQHEPIRWTDGACHAVRKTKKARAVYPANTTRPTHGGWRGSRGRWPAAASLRRHHGAASAQATRHPGAPRARGVVPPGPSRCPATDRHGTGVQEPLAAEGDRRGGDAVGVEAGVDHQDPGQVGGHPPDGGGQDDRVLRRSSPAVIPAFTWGSASAIVCWSPWRTRGAKRSSVRANSIRVEQFAVGPQPPDGGTDPLLDTAGGVGLAGDGVALGQAEAALGVGQDAPEQVVLRHEVPVEDAPCRPPAHPPGR